MPPLRCFMGLELPGHCQNTLRRLTGLLAARLASRITWTRPENAHLTLKFLGDVPQEALPALCEALRAVRFAPFALRLGGAGCFPAWTLGAREQNGRGAMPDRGRGGAKVDRGRGGAKVDRGRGGAPQVLWAGVEQGGAEVSALARAVDLVCQPLGFAPQNGTYTPHLTLGRVREAARHTSAGEAARHEGAGEAARHEGAGEDWGAALDVVARERWQEVRVERFVLWRSILGPAGPKYAPLEAFPADAGGVAGCGG